MEAWAGMSLNILYNRCKGCGADVPMGKRGGPTLCVSCSNRKKYQKRKFMQKIARLKQKKCHSCGGIILREGVYCSDYCKWIRMLDRRHQKIIKRIADL